MKSFNSAFAILVVMLLSMTTAYSTPYWTLAELDSARTVNNSEFLLRNLETGTRAPHQTLDEIAYFFKYRQLCDFLAGMQVTSAGVNFGGMREGEVGSDFTIIQTDNTQEAIRVWSQYAIWTGDTARYGQNIRNAWIYNAEWPAWEEEGGGYYAMHNCGWGFEAVAKYREAYQDTSMDWYADACANWVMANPLNLNGALNYAAQGLGIGGMYPHAIYRGRTDWQDHTLARARLIRNWFQANPSRLNNATEWALCGGTAIWGVCNSLWIAYPDSGAMWIEEYGENLETWESPDSWYNAYNTWYSNATFRFWEISGDSLYWNRGVFYADSLVGFDDDNDGGIPPGTCCINNDNDHTWVSAYMGWMGLERIISSGPIMLAEIQGVVTPAPALPLLEGDTVPVTITVANLGTDTVQVLVRVEDNMGSYLSGSEVTSLLPGEAADLPMILDWELPDANVLQEDLQLLIYMHYWSSESLPDSQTSELVVTLDLRHATSVFGTITGQHDMSTVPCHIDFYCEGYPDSIWTSVDIPAGQPYSNGDRPLLEGSNRMLITTPLRYMLEERSFVTLPDNTDPYDIWLTSSDIVLVDDDNGAAYDTFIVNSLNELDYQTRIVRGAPTADMSLALVERVLWMTGNDATTTLTPADHTLLESYLSSGGGLLLTGQNITDDPANEQFLEDVLLCTPDRDDTDRLHAYGIGGLPPVQDQHLLLLGSQGAANQNSPSSLIPLDGATVCYVNDTTDLEMIGIYGEHDFGKFIFLTFGLEAVSGQANTTARTVALESLLSSLVTVDVPNFPEIPNTFTLYPAYPNPFNSSVQIEWYAPIGATATSVEIYDVLGRRVAELYNGASSVGLHRATWNGSSTSGAQVTSGTYFVRLTASDMTQVRTLRLVR